MPNVIFPYQGPESVLSTWTTTNTNNTNIETKSSTIFFDTGTFGYETLNTTVISRLAFDFSDKENKVIAAQNGIEIHYNTMTGGYATARIPYAYKIINSFTYTFGTNETTFSEVGLVAVLQILLQTFETTNAFIRTDSFIITRKFDPYINGISYSHTYTFWSFGMTTASSTLTTHASSSTLTTTNTWYSYGMFFTGFNTETRISMLSGYSTNYDLPSTYYFGNYILSNTVVGGFINGIFTDVSSVSNDFIPPVIPYNLHFNL